MTLITYEQAIETAERVYKRTGTLSTIRGDTAEHLQYSADIMILAGLFRREAIEVARDLKARVGG